MGDGLTEGECHTANLGPHHTPNFDASNWQAAAFIGDSLAQGASDMHKTMKNPGHHHKHKQAHAKHVSDHEKHHAPTYNGKPIEGLPGLSKNKKPLKETKPKAEHKEKKADKPAEKEVRLPHRFEKLEKMEKAVAAEPENKDKKEALKTEAKKP